MGFGKKGTEQLNLDYPDLLGLDKIVRIIEGPDKVPNKTD